MLGRRQWIRKAVARRVGDPWQAAGDDGGPAGQSPPEPEPEPQPEGRPKAPGHLIPLRHPHRGQCDLLLRIPRQGVYVVTDASGAEVADIRGDYVIGFHARYPGVSRVFPSLAEAKEAIAAEHERRLAATAAPLPG